MITKFINKFRMRHVKLPACLHQVSPDFEMTVRQIDGDIRESCESANEEAFDTLITDRYFVIDITDKAQNEVIATLNLGYAHKGEGNNISAPDCFIIFKEFAIDTITIMSNKCSGDGEKYFSRKGKLCIYYDKDEYDSGGDYALKFHLGIAPDMGCKVKTDKTPIGKYCSQTIKKYPFTQGCFFML
ncbi:MAG: hypothetical protein ACI9TY_001261 [Alphaproteobacteria bacterium]|jgi:hypothetical protein